MAQHYRAPSIDSSTFAVAADAGDGAGAAGADDSSTDSYQDSQDGGDDVFDPAEYLSSALDAALASVQTSRSMVLQAQT